jgi:hypothetical protein
MLVVDLCELVDFCDANKAARRHANAIKTVFLEELSLEILRSYLERKWGSATRLPNPCTAAGARLDGWIRTRISGAPTLLQVEVKSWSFHGFGGGPSLPVTCLPAQLAQYKISHWAKYWSSGQFADPKLNKVLTPMRPPASGVAVEPLACLWHAVHPTGLAAPLFDVSVARGHKFKRVWVFSVSAFAREELAKGRRTIRLSLPNADARLQYLGAIFPTLRPCVSALPVARTTGETGETSGAVNR